MDGFNFLYVKYFLEFSIANAIFSVPANSPKDDVPLKMSAMERVHVLILLQKRELSLSTLNICNSAVKTTQNSQLERYSAQRKGQLHHPASDGLTPAEQFYLLAT
ncbi:MAG: hypothetical protein ACRDCA_25130 [Serratia sp. (in: enterobacteria)]|uniref:hypothetical protein n=1 Tax=Serratia sp. (in: enterobacteria) TaxID=616 RepID=UPI003F3DC608